MINWKLIVISAIGIFCLGVSFEKFLESKELPTYAWITVSNKEYSNDFQVKLNPNVWYYVQCKPDFSCTIKSIKASE